MLTVFEAVACVRLGRWALGKERFEASSRLYAEAGSVAGQAHCQRGIAWTLGEMGRPHESLKVAQDAYELQRRDASATLRLLRKSLRQVAEGHIFVGNYQEALNLCAELDAMDDGTRLPCEAAMDELSRAGALLGLGEFSSALEVLDRVLEGYREFASSADIATAQMWIGDAHHGLGDFDAARNWWTNAFGTFEYHGHPYEQKVCAKLAALPEN
jgi:tetratricopeptide (TPR) repeat protein